MYQGLKMQKNEFFGKRTGILMNDENKNKSLICLSIFLRLLSSLNLFVLINHDKSILEDDLKYLFIVLVWSQFNQASPPLAEFPQVMTELPPFTAAKADSVAVRLVTSFSHERLGAFKSYLSNSKLRSIVFLLMLHVHYILQTCERFCLILFFQSSCILKLLPDAPAVSTVVAMTPSNHWAIGF